jgi:hypothetical protein
MIKNYSTLNQKTSGGSFFALKGTLILASAALHKASFYIQQ